MFAVYLHITGGRINPLLMLSPLLIAGCGFGIFAAPLQLILLTGLTTEEITAASGIVPTVEQIGGSLGLAFISALFFRSHTIDGSAMTFSALAGIISFVLACLALSLPDRNSIRQSDTITLP